MPLIPEHSGWLIENDGLKTVPYDGRYLPADSANMGKLSHPVQTLMKYIAM